MQSSRIFLAMIQMEDLEICFRCLAILLLDSGFALQSWHFDIWQIMGKSSVTLLKQRSKYKLILLVSKEKKVSTSRELNKMCHNFTRNVETNYRLDCLCLIYRNDDVKFLKMKQSVAQNDQLMTMT